MCACVPYTYETRHCVLTLSFFYIYAPISHSSGNEHRYIHKNILLLLYRYRTGVFLSCEVFFALIVCVNDVRHLCFALQKMHTYAYVYVPTHTIINAIHVYLYVGVSFSVYFRLSLNGICRAAACNSCAVTWISISMTRVHRQI